MLFSWKWWIHPSHIGFTHPNTVLLYYAWTLMFTNHICGVSFADIETLPQPNSNRVVKKQLPGRYVAAIRFTGLPFDWEVTAAEGQLRQALARDGLWAAAGYSLARYNEPFVPPPVRRNEVLIDLVDFEWPMP